MKRGYRVKVLPLLDLNIFCKPKNTAFRETWTFKAEQKYILSISLHTFINRSWNGTEQFFMQNKQSENDLGLICNSHIDNSTSYIKNDQG